MILFSLFLKYIPADIPNNAYVHAVNRDHTPIVPVITSKLNIARRQNSIPDNHPHFFEKGIIVHIIGSTLGKWGKNLMKITIKSPIIYLIKFCWGFIGYIYLKSKNT